MKPPPPPTPAVSPRRRTGTVGFDSTRTADEEEITAASSRTEFVTIHRQRAGTVLKPITNIASGEPDSTRREPIDWAALGVDRSEIVLARFGPEPKLSDLDSPAVSLQTLWTAAFSNTPTLSTAAAGHAAVTSQILTALCAFADEVARERAPAITLEDGIDLTVATALFSGRMPAYVIAMIDRHHHPLWRGLSAALARTPEAVVVRLAADDDPTVRQMFSVLGPPNLVRGPFTSFPPNVRYAIAKRKHVRTKHLRDLAMDADDSVRTAVADRPDLPVTVARILTRDPSSPVRASLAFHSTLPDIRSILADDTDANVRRSATRQRRCP